MHHPDICNIILIIDGYFLLLDSMDKCEIEPYVDDSDEYHPEYGVIIRRKLINGYLQATICGQGEDDDTVTFDYLQDLNSRNILESIEIECGDYSNETVNSAIRNIMIADKQFSQSRR
jgi:hypothetical protein